MKTQFVNGVNLCYEIIGEGFPFIYLMGKNSNMDWPLPSFKAALSKKNKLIMLDNRGAGRSDAPSETYGISDMAKDVIGLMDALEINKAHLFGLSMGGMIAQEIAIEYPERVEKLILCSTTSKITRLLPTIKMLKLLLRRSTVFSPQETIDMLYSAEYIKNNAEQINALIERMKIAPSDPRSIEIHHQACNRFDAYHRLNRIVAPTLILHGEDDWVFQPKHANILNRRIVGSKLILFPQAGHGLLLQEFRKVFEEIQLFI
jgi:pimeloyl-ACP methyl ester carboxylesterase